MKMNMKMEGHKGRKGKVKGKQGNEARNSVGKRE